jgi:hypothetical protein
MREGGDEHWKLACAGYSMELSAALWSGLPSEIIEQVLSFVPVPDLCRYRAVCTTWNRLICNPKFAAVHAAKRRDHAISFIVMSFNYTFKADRQAFRKSSTCESSSWCVLDLTARRWYTVKNDLYRFKRDSDIMAMGAGLVCQYLETESQSNSIIVHNPVATTGARVLPTAPDHFTSQSFPELSLVFKYNSHFKVILINHSFNDKDILDDPMLPPEVRSLIQTDPFVRVYDSGTNAWACMANPTWIFNGIGHIRRSIMFQGFLHVLFYAEKEYQLWRYGLEENAWEKLAVPISGDFKYPELVVTGDRFFLVAWYCKRFCLALNGGLKNLKERRWFYKLFEIKVPGMRRETLFDLSKAKVVSLFDVKTGVENSECQYPRMSVFSFGSSLLFMSNSSGKSMSFDVVTRKWDHAWPQNPLGYLPDEDCSWVGEHMNLLLPASTLWSEVGVTASCPA